MEATLIQVGLKYKAQFPLMDKSKDSIDEKSNCHKAVLELRTLSVSSVRNRSIPLIIAEDKSSPPSKGILENWASFWATIKAEGEKRWKKQKKVTANILSKCCLENTPIKIIPFKIPVIWKILIFKPHTKLFLIHEAIY